jgi:hypothetical protein
MYTLQKQIFGSDEKWKQSGILQKWKQTFHNIRKYGSEDKLYKSKIHSIFF